MTQVATVPGAMAETDVAAGAASATGALPGGERSLKSRALRGSAWTLLGFGGGQVMRFGANIVLSWLVTPAVFGVVGLVNTVLQGLQMFSDVGTGPSIIQSARGDDPRFLNTAWTIQTIRGALLWLACFIVAWPVAQFYGESSLATFVPVAGVTALLAGFNSTSLFTANRRLALGKLTAIELAAQAIGIGTMIVWALQSPTPWALLGGGIAATAARLVMSHSMLEGPRNWFAWDREAAAELLRFGKWIFVSTLITFFALKIDRLMLGRLDTMAALGVYFIAVNLTDVLKDVVRRLTNSTLFPALAELRRTQSEEELRTRFWKARAVILSAGAAASLALALWAPLFFGLAYPEAYHAAGWIAQLLVIGAWASLLTASADRLLLAMGDSRILAVSNAVRLLVTVGGALGGFALWGLAGFALGAGVGAIAGHVVIQAALAKRRMWIFGQDVKYTAALAAPVAVGALGAWWAREVVGGRGAIVIEAALAAALTGVVSVWAMRRVLARVR